MSGFLQRVNLFIWERKEKVIKSLSIMKDMVGDLRSATVNPKHWPTVHIYWPLLESNELIKDLPIVEIEDRGNYSLRYHQEIERHITV